MADELQRPPEPKGPRGWAHDWYPYQSYIDIHESHIETLFKQGLIVETRLSFREYRQGKELRSVNLVGTVTCANGIEVIIDKWLDVRRGSRRRYEVKGSSYSYQAVMRATGEELLRYDSAHGLDELHRHRFEGGREVAKERVSLEELPSLDGFIRQAIAAAERA